ncbi:MAG: hypothetical protein KKG47_01025 [Proteobacteria bacterium]|nr:hypothetical protein [Pseudomonadota bacterium]MBU1739495.1 hypothetical protein [Pseudomonadota bacterium]
MMISVPPGAAGANLRNNRMIPLSFLRLSDQASGGRKADFWIPAKNMPE